MMITPHHTSQPSKKKREKTDLRALQRGVIGDGREHVIEVHTVVVAGPMDAYVCVGMGVCVN